MTVLHRPFLLQRDRSDQPAQPHPYKGFVWASIAKDAGDALYYLMHGSKGEPGISCESSMK